MLIGKYQLQNLKNNGVRFHFFEIIDEEIATGLHAKQSPLLVGCQKLSASNAVEELEKQGLSKDAPIVLICEHGMKSMELAAKLEQNSFLNVYVVEGGKHALD
jgi:rhodanese-related sulfurtransferase